MPGGRRNPLSMSAMIEQLGEVVQNTKTNVHQRKSSLQKKMGEHGLNVPYHDLTIQVCSTFLLKIRFCLLTVFFAKFIGANGLPKMDVVGSADPYFVASIDDKISFV